MELCTDYNFLQGILYVKYIIVMAMAIVPVVIIVMGSIAGAKAIMSGNQEDLMEIFRGTLRRVASVFIILMLPSVLNIIFSNFSNFSELSSTMNLCYENADKQIIANFRTAKLNSLEGANYESKDFISKYTKEKYNVAVSTANGTNPETNTNLGVSGQGNFQKYNLSESQLNDLAAVAKAEQGSKQGIAAEASIMANLFEIRGGKFGQGADGLYKYVDQSGWFGSSAVSVHKAKATPSQEDIAIVKAVLMDGKRTLPAYVDEHDCWNCNAKDVCSDGKKGDICTLDTGGSSTSSMDSIKDHGSYKQHETLVHNVYGSSYTFYSFPETNSDPFGYTSADLRQKLGDDCYSVDQLS